jgi:group I intron endonuclease
MKTPIYFVYQIVYLPTGKYYIGRTQNVVKRWDRHQKDLKDQTHHNIHMNTLVKNGYKPEDWEYKILGEFEDKKQADSEEERLICLGHIKEQCLNIGKNSVGGDNFSKHPEREKLIAGRKKDLLNWRLNLTDAEKKHFFSNSGVSNGMFGRTHSDAAKKIMSLARIGNNYAKGHKRSDETKAKLSEIASERIGDKNPFYGRRHTEETKKKLAEANAGKKPPNMRPVVAAGQIYPSVTEAARFLKVTPALVIYRIKSTKWEYHYLINA